MEPIICQVQASAKGTRSVKKTFIVDEKYNLIPFIDYQEHPELDLVFLESEKDIYRIYEIIEVQASCRFIIQLDKIFIDKQTALDYRNSNSEKILVIIEEDIIL